MNWKRWIALTCLLWGGAPVGAATPQASDWKVPPRSARKKNPVKSDAAAIAAGRSIYSSQCVSCHGESGRGDGPAANDLEVTPIDLGSKGVQAQTDGALFWKITTGRAPMTAFKDALSAKQRWQVVHFVRSLGKPTTPLTTPAFEASAEMRATASTLFEAYNACRVTLVKGDDVPITAAIKGLLGSVKGLQALPEKSIPKKTAAAWAKATSEVATRANTLSSSKGIDARRQAFAKLSSSSEAIWAQFGHGFEKALQVYKGQNGTWVQGDSKPVNPYTGDPFKDAPVRRIAGERPKKGKSATTGHPNSKTQIGGKYR